MNQQLSRRCLQTFCGFIPDAHPAFLMVHDEQNKVMITLEHWPAKLQLTNDYAVIVKHALRKERQVSLPNFRSDDGHDYDCSALPYFAESWLLGLIVVIVLHKPNTQWWVYETK